MKNFIRTNIKKLIISSVIILCPILLGIILWDTLPEIITTHWNISGEADGFSGKAMAVFAIPAFLLAFHWLCMIITSFDKKNINQNKKAMGIIFWICPLLSLYFSALIYSIAFGYEIDIVSLSFLLFGILFIVIGNYLPKVKQNRTLGIKILWTLKNEENWNATHRFGGKVWVIGGIIILFLTFIPIYISAFAFGVILVSMIFIPIIYSYNYFKKQVKNGYVNVEESNAPKSRKSKIAMIFSYVSVAAILIFCVYICFSGNIEYVFEDDSLTINASYWEDISLNYDEIDTVEYRQKDDYGTRTFGFGTPRLLLGTFENDEFGRYTRYSYGTSDSCIVISSKENILVISGIDSSETQDIYNKLVEKCN